MAGRSGGARVRPRSETRPTLSAARAASRASSRGGTARVCIGDLGDGGARERGRRGRFAGPRRSPETAGAPQRGATAVVKGRAQNVASVKAVVAALRI